jgi:hypothetical protein
MFNYNAFHWVGKNSQSSHVRIPCSDKNATFFWKETTNFVLMTFMFCGQNKNNCEDQKEKMGHEKIKCLFFGIN